MRQFGTLALLSILHLTPSTAFAESAQIDLERLYGMDASQFRPSDCPIFQGRQEGREFGFRISCGENGNNYIEVRTGMASPQTIESINAGTAAEVCDQFQDCLFTELITRDGWSGLSYVEYMRDRDQYMSVITLLSGPADLTVISIASDRQVSEFNSALMLTKLEELILCDGYTSPWPNCPVNQ